VILTAFLPIVPPTLLPGESINQVNRPSSALHRSYYSRLVCVVYYVSVCMYVESLCIE
jgi:hypothetical protein